MTDRRFRVVVTDFIADELAPEKEILGDIADVVALNAFSEEDLRGSIEDADAIMLYHNLSIRQETIARLTRCKLIVRCGVGFDNVDYRFARERGIDVGNVPDYGTEEVADSAIGMMLTLTRGIHYLNATLQNKPGEWTYLPVAPLHRLRGRTFGVLGLGRIGTAAALRAKALGMDVLFYDPYRPDGTDKSFGLRRVDSLEDLLRQSFVLSLHTPLTPETKQIIDAAAIAKMAPGSYLVNTSRGAVADPHAVLDAVLSGHLAGAGLDVLPTEPPSEDDRLLRAWRDPQSPAYSRLILNPHSAFYCEEGLREMRTKGSQACRKALLNLPLTNRIN
ncbi:C-terminal binding protein [Tuwongella immobilis]|uniref:C-terminal binding protein n=1 Tax=Tuwongella immobilis TaxID=692036 RepID=A0A6C2YUY9_9BACT|nr:C-terminal binding protein [Tuwongella immobilis]VIP04692.1 phosphoglycerate dehydrogenase : D-isomer specific 2-hydroxyacid dehydrogenase family protein OS=uncultured planctomycete 6N14 GN=6N14_30 PE=3 SV=1: 2-Hacid_dh: 2-Hacid_dh_C [Tuwongella immobilis]VTS06743.1 phosphoglycerate dehydrogenase : D-isomer specific 2-hydroxyacid dehydrogenase family protein OS=uncultured planctomycete 6N14 GN=6N14_30 PE=3 SV=1: 2-Hacid_dh: 2-Hacid_dh_C [Tuwongella immobilis]